MRNSRCVNDLYSTGKMGKQKRGRCGLSSIIFGQPSIPRLAKRFDKLEFPVEIQIKVENIFSLFR